MKKIILAIILSVSMVGLCMAGPRNSCANGSCSKQAVTKTTKEVKTIKTVKKSTKTDTVKVVAPKTTVSVRPVQTVKSLKPLRVVKVLKVLRPFKRNACVSTRTSVKVVDKTVLLA